MVFYSVQSLGRLCGITFTMSCSTFVSSRKSISGGFCWWPWFAGGLSHNRGDEGCHQRDVDSDRRLDLWKWNDSCPSEDRGDYVHAQMGIPPAGLHLEWSRSNFEESGEVILDSKLNFTKHVKTVLASPANSTKVIGHFMPNVANPRCLNGVC